MADGWTEEDLNDPSLGPGIFDASSGTFVLAVTGEMAASFAGSHGTLSTWEPTIAETVTDGYFQGTVAQTTQHGSTVSLLARTIRLRARIMDSSQAPCTARSASKSSTPRSQNHRRFSA